MSKKPFSELSREELLSEYNKLVSEYEKIKEEGIKLDMSRGKPSPEQLDLSDGMLDILKNKEDCIDGTADTRNYGILCGLPSARKLFADLCHVDTENVFVGGASSLQLMFDAVARAEIFGVDEASLPWSKCEKVKFLCPAPGYDRHFSICETFGIEMIPVEMTESGPDMDAVEKLVSTDETIKGIWCVPKHSNPTGAIYSDETVKRFASLSPAAKDFRIFWDNAYMVHDLNENTHELLNIFSLTKGTKNENMVYMFTSTSKITHAGSGISAFITSADNMEYAKKYIGAQIISYDKVNQLRHVKFFKDADGVLSHMKKHAALLRPRFETVLKAFDGELSGLGIAKWSRPTGGYFISLDVTGGSAKRVYELCSDAGVTLTNVGATFPYGKDPCDENLRIAPSYPSVEELKKASEILCLCVKIACAETYLK